MHKLLLRNKIVAITRNEHEAKEFSELVNEQGGRSIALPTIEIVPTGPLVAQEFIDRLQRKKHHYCAFMSSQAVNILFDFVDEQKVMAALKPTAVIAVGPKTKQSLEKHGIPVKLVPEKFSSLGLVEMMGTQSPVGRSIIIPRSDASNEFVAESLKSLGMKVDEIFLYAVRACKPTSIWSEFSSLLQQRKIDAIIFTSASTVEAFFEIIGKLLAMDLTQADNNIHLNSLTKVVSIGPFTSKELEKRKIRYSEAMEHTIKGIFELTLRIVV